MVQEKGASAPIPVEIFVQKIHLKSTMATQDTIQTVDYSTAFPPAQMIVAKTFREEQRAALL